MKYKARIFTDRPNTSYIPFEWLRKKAAWFLIGTKDIITISKDSTEFENGLHPGIDGKYITFSSNHILKEYDVLYRNNINMIIEDVINEPPVEEGYTFSMYTGKYCILSEDGKEFLRGIVVREYEGRENENPVRGVVIGNNGYLLDKYRSIVVIPPSEDVRDEYKKCMKDFPYWFDTYYKIVRYGK